MSQLHVFVEVRLGGRVLGPCTALLALAALVLVAGCGTDYFPTSVHVLRTDAFPDNHIPPFEETVANQAKAVRLYSALLALPAYPSGTVKCPADFGVVYQLLFQGMASIQQHMSVQAGGCRGVSFNGTSHWTHSAATSPQFWPLFAETLGVPESVVYPVVAQPTGPSAPTPVP